MTLEVKNRRESDIYRSKFRSKNELEGKAQWLKITKNVSFEIQNEKLQNETFQCDFQKV